MDLRPVVLQLENPADINGFEVASHQLVGGLKSGTACVKKLRNDGRTHGWNLKLC